MYKYLYTPEPEQTTIEERVAKLEELVEDVRRWITELDADIDRLRDNIKGYPPP